MTTRTDTIMENLIREAIASADAAGVPRHESAKMLLIAGIGAMIGVAGHAGARTAASNTLNALEDAVQKAADTNSTEPANMVAHASMPTTQLYARRSDNVRLDEVVKINIRG